MKADGGSVDGLAVDEHPALPLAPHTAVLTQRQRIQAATLTV